MVKVIEAAKVIKFETKEDRDKRIKEAQSLRRILKRAEKLKW